MTRQIASERGLTIVMETRFAHTTCIKIFIEKSQSLNKTSHSIYEQCGFSLKVGEVQKVIICIQTGIGIKDVFCGCTRWGNCISCPRVIMLICPTEINLA